ncbi:hypothetical protein ABT304_18985 [Nocardioides sp. NPDC000445]|uniref:dual OB domain-containing protein n=1 Tax=Nocardioides sp. NPDC000445 TaxID=3154257 RepID=UPI00332302A8
MVEIKTIVCLANSWKHHDSCVAGIELTQGGDVGDWIRPVSARQGHGISLKEQTLTDGTAPQVLDVIAIGLRKYAPKEFQVENWLLDPQVQWTRVERLTYADAAAIVDTPATLWTLGHSTQLGTNDCVPARELESIENSLVLVAVNNATVVVEVNPWDGKTQVRLAFDYNGEEYVLRVTDPDHHGRYEKLGKGRYDLSPQTLVTVSLVEPWARPDGTTADSYKVVAAIIQP